VKLLILPGLGILLGLGVALPIEKNDPSGAIIEAQQRAAAALVQGDEKAIKDLYSPAFSTAGGDFQIKSRDELLQGLASGQYRYNDIRSDVSEIKIASDNTAVVIGNRTVVGKINGKDFSASFSFKAVYTLNSAQQWQVVLIATNPC
jgi:hypothetical protein